MKLRCLLAAMLLASAAAADDAVVVTGERDPVDKSYRKMVKGMDLFEEMRAMAPGAALRYKLLPRSRETRMDGIELKVVGDSFEADVPLAKDRTFTLERDAKALEENAAVRPNRKAASMTWRTEVRSPGLPADTRRLGDQRLECHVGMEAGLVSNERPLVGMFASLIQKLLGFCSASDAPYLFFSERALFGVTLVSGARREALPVEQLYAGIGNGRVTPADLAYCDCQVLLDRTYFLPLGDKSWPDDTRVELEYMHDREGNSGSALGNIGKDELRTVLGEARVIRFDSGYEVWVYPLARDRRAGEELVVLLDPSGAVAKTRLREDARQGVD